jgi:dTDP-4-amino-4,6-dideoxygalactose transaminase
MASYRIPCNRPGLAGNELRYIQESVDSGGISGDGVFTEKCRRLFTFVSTASAVVLRGARLVFADIRPDTLNVDERLLPALVTPRTPAILPVHYGCEMDAIRTVGRQQDR